jgi:hypothetical protein
LSYAVSSNILLFFLYVLVKTPRLLCQKSGRRSVILLIFTIDWMLAQFGYYFGLNFLQILYFFILNSSARLSQSLLKQTINDFFFAICICVYFFISSYLFITFLIFFYVCICNKTFSFSGWNRYWCVRIGISDSLQRWKVRGVVGGDFL